MSKYVTELSDRDMVKYQNSYEKLVKMVQEIAEVEPKPSKLLGVIDLRGQMGGKALIHETAVTEGVLYLEVPQSTFALSVISFVRYLKRKGITPVRDPRPWCLEVGRCAVCTANPLRRTVLERRDGEHRASTMDQPLERSCKERHGDLPRDVEWSAGDLDAFVHHDEDSRSDLGQGEPTSAALGVSRLWQLQGGVGVVSSDR